MYRLFNVQAHPPEPGTGLLPGAKLVHTAKGGLGPFAVATAARRIIKGEDQVHDQGKQDQQHEIEQIGFTRHKHLRSIRLWIRERTRSAPYAQPGTWSVPSRFENSLRATMLPRSREILR